MRCREATSLRDCGWIEALISYVLHPSFEVAYMALAPTCSLTLLPIPISVIDMASHLFS
jgi:hypothetical protein